MIIKENHDVPLISNSLSIYLTSALLYQYIQ